MNQMDITDTVELWVKRIVEFSSEYDKTGWAANMVIGAPQVYPRYGDIRGAWAQGNSTADEFITMEFSEKLFVSGVEIYETLHAGAVIKVLALKPETEEWISLWEADDLTPLCIQSSRCFKPPLKEVDFRSDQLKLVVDCTAAQSWCEIDAVKLKGTKLQMPKPPPLSTLSDQLRQLINSNTFSDVTFDLDGSQVYAHKVILSARSTYFREVLSSDSTTGDKLSEQTVMIDGVTYGGFITLMHFIYANSFDETVEPLHLMEVIRVADKFSLEGAKVLAYCRLCHSLDVNNVVDIYCDAVNRDPRLADVETTCLNFIARNLDQVTQSKSFCDLSQESMLHIVQETAARLSI